MYFFFLEIMSKLKILLVGTATFSLLYEDTDIVFSHRGDWATDRLSDYE
jgi:hypothetical protein